MMMQQARTRLGDSLHFLALRYVSTQAKQANQIKFYREKDLWGELSNFYPAPIEFLQKTYPSSEHLYQALKYLTPNSAQSNEYAEVIRKASTPYKAKWIANQKVGGPYRWQRDLSETIKKFQKYVKPRADWDAVKDEMMLLCLRAKFTQNSHCYNILCNTQDAQLVECSNRDNYWGTGGDGSGSNVLGKLLMQVRDEMVKK